MLKTKNRQNLGGEADSEEGSMQDLSMPWLLKKATGPEDHVRSDISLSSALSWGLPLLPAPAEGPKQTSLSPGAQIPLSWDNRSSSSSSGALGILQVWPGLDLGSISGRESFSEAWRKSFPTASFIQSGPSHVSLSLWWSSARHLPSTESKSGTVFSFSVTFLPTLEYNLIVQEFISLGTE